MALDRTSFDLDRSPCLPSLTPEDLTETDARALSSLALTEHHHHGHLDPADGLPYGKFVPAVLVQLCLAGAVAWWVAPERVAWELGRPWAVVAMTLALGVPLSLFEYLYHRYLLHSSVLPFMKAMHEAHSEHHGLTTVKAAVTPHEPERKAEVDSEYPVEHKHQEASQMFPLFSLAIFYALFFVLLSLPLLALAPGVPSVVPTIAAVTLFYVGYEVWHAVLHLPFDGFWRPLLEGERTKGPVGRIYSFHLMHHWRPVSNLAVVGLWGYAVWDHMFRTHHRPANLPLDGAEVDFHDAKLPVPRWPVSALDRLQPRLYKVSRRLEKALARVFLRR